jgi:hypothetical protein
MERNTIEGSRLRHGERSVHVRQDNNKIVFGHQVVKQYLGFYYFLVL